MRRARGRRGESSLMQQCPVISRAEQWFSHFKKNKWSKERNCAWQALVLFSTSQEPAVPLVSPESAKKSKKVQISGKFCAFMICLCVPWLIEISCILYFRPLQYILFISVGMPISSISWFFIITGNDPSIFQNLSLGLCNEMRLIYRSTKNIHFCAHKNLISLKRRGKIYQIYIFARAQAFLLNFVPLS